MLCHTHCCGNSDTCVIFATVTDCVTMAFKRGPDVLHCPHDIAFCNAVAYATVSKSETSAAMSMLYRCYPQCQHIDSVAYATSVNVLTVQRCVAVLHCATTLSHTVALCNVDAALWLCRRLLAAPRTHPACQRLP